MKMISQHAIRKQIRHWRKMLLVQFQEKVVIPFFNENVLTIHAAIVDVIVGVEK